MSSKADVIAVEPQVMEAEGYTLVLSSSNKTGYRGVYTNPSNASRPYMASVQEGEKRINLKSASGASSFATSVEAALAVARYRAEHPQPKQQSGSRRRVGARTAKRARQDDGFDRTTYEDVKNAESDFSWESNEGDDGDDGNDGGEGGALRVGTLVEVEVEEDGHTVWRRGEVRRRRSNGEFQVCVFFANGEPDEKFLEFYKPSDQGTEWRHVTEYGATEAVEGVEVEVEGADKR